MTRKRSEWFSLAFSYVCSVCLFDGFIVYWLACWIIRLFVLCMFVRPRGSGSRETFRLVIETNPGMISKSLGSRVFRF